MLSSRNVETFSPIILRQQAQDESTLEKETRLNRLKARGNNMKSLVTVVLTRPFRMFKEPLVLFTDLFLLYQYSILFLYFEAYPIIFKGEASTYSARKILY